MTEKETHDAQPPATEQAFGCNEKRDDQRELLVTYLRYVVAEVAQINATSASLLLMAIADLEGKRQGCNPLQPQ